MNRDRGHYDVQFVSGVKTLSGSSRSTSRMPMEHGGQNLGANLHVLNIDYRLLNGHKLVGK